MVRLTFETTLAIQLTVSADTNTHKYPPEDDDADDRDSRGVRSQGLGHRSENNEHKLDTVHWQ